MHLALCLLMLTAVNFTLTEDVEDEPLPDYYAILKVSHTATVKEIKKSFRVLAMKYHPDKNKDEEAQEIFKELSEAYSILSDQEKKAEYDELYTMDSGDHEHSEQSEEDLSEDEKVSQNESENKEDASSAWGDLDDETLYRVLKFLADHDYEITKKKVYRPQEHNAEHQYSGSSGSSYSEQFHKGHSTHKQYAHKRNSHKEHAHNPWVEDPEFKYAHGSVPSHSYIPAQHNCRTTVSWEGATRVTLKSCF